MPAATAAPRRQRATPAPSSDGAPLLPRWHWSISITLLLIGAVAFAFLVPLRVCEPCRGLGTVTLLSRCVGCQGDGLQTSWDLVSNRYLTKR
jgi:hypothetical protein